MASIKLYLFQWNCIQNNENKILPNNGILLNSVLRPKLLDN